MKIWTVLIQETFNSRRYVLGAFNSKKKAEEAIEIEFNKSKLYSTTDGFYISNIQEWEVK